MRRLVLIFAFASACAPAQTGTPAWPGSRPSGRGWRRSFWFSPCAAFVPRWSFTPGGTSIRHRLRSSVP